MSSASSLSHSSSTRRISMHSCSYEHELGRNGMLNQDISYSFRRTTSSGRHYKLVDATVSRDGSVSRPVLQSSIPLKQMPSISKCKGGYWIKTDTDFVILELSVSWDGFF